LSQEIRQKKDHLHIWIHKCHWLQRISIPFGQQQQCDITVGRR